MKDIYYNFAVARLCGDNRIIKAVLLNYIFNYHKPNPRKGPGSPASISLREFVYQYKVGDGGLWKRSFIHKILKDLQKDGHLINTPDNGLPVYTVSSQFASLLADPQVPLISFDLEMACKHGIHVAIMHRFLLHVIDHSPDKVAYNLNIYRMTSDNGLSRSQIYKAIAILKDMKVVMPVKSELRYRSRALSLARYKD